MCVYLEGSWCPGARGVCPCACLRAAAERAADAGTWRWCQDGPQEAGDHVPDPASPGYCAHSWSRWTCRVECSCRAAAPRGSLRTETRRTRGAHSPPSRPGSAWRSPKWCRFRKTFSGREVNFGVKIFQIRTIKVRKYLSDVKII